MRFEYLFLLLLSILPLVYKLWYWDDILQGLWWEKSSFRGYIFSKKWRGELSHFWVSLELPIFLASFLHIFHPPFEIFMYNILFYILLLYNIFVIGKILRKNFSFPRLNVFICKVLLIQALLWAAFINNNSVYIYSYICWILLSQPLIFLWVLYSSRAKVYK